jgi:hypothetical protein
MVVLKMNYRYDLYGWYVGEVEKAVQRSTTIAPDNLTLSAKPGDMRANWTGHKWVDRPYVYAEPTQRRAENKDISPVRFKLLFTPQERLIIKNLRSTDPVIDDWYELLDDPRLATINPSDSSVVAVLSYLVNIQVLSDARKASIMASLPVQYEQTPES